ncbi:MAG: hypothetical protein KGJ13_04960 [Patescibacteria group bacterium]|nr:hypothetical protein [Patescibacteria group bacterium]
MIILRKMALHARDIAMIVEVEGGTEIHFKNGQHITTVTDLQTIVLIVDYELKIYGEKP